MAFLAGILRIFSEIDISGQKHLEQIFASRESLNPEQFYERYFRDQGIPKDTVVRIKKVFDENISFDMTRLSSSDDFSKELKFIWDYDSMADVETVIALEKEFGIQLTDEEATSMKTMNDIVRIIHAKTSARPNVPEPKDIG